MREDSDTRLASAAAEDFGLRPVSVRAAEGGCMKETYIVEAAEGEFVAQRYRYGDYIREKFGFIRALAQFLNEGKSGLLYPDYICTPGGDWFSRGFCMQRLIPGSGLPEYTPAAAENAAAALRTFHRQCDRFRGGAVPVRHFAARKNAYYERAALYGCGIVHGEYRVRNILFDCNVPTGIIDFDSVCRGERFWDIAYLMLDFLENAPGEGFSAVERIHRAYRADCPAEAAYAALAVLVEDYVGKCRAGYLKHNRKLRFAEYEILLKELKGKCR